MRGHFKVVDRYGPFLDRRVCYVPTVLKSQWEQRKGQEWLKLASVVMIDGSITINRYDTETMLDELLIEEAE